ncbi:hypothetical protein Bca4012_076666 [Brassica carinata]|uniref:RRM domain-containing protein n=1 Tax=Brassica oleracea TaxID=3712 RepID=A0A3P6EIZ8_BRAOL|nr:unnamed protein product [Brassica oleracea]
MAMGRLLLTPKLNPHFSIRGFLPLTRRWSSSSSSLEDGRDSKASANKDIGQKGMHCYSFGALLTNLKQKIMGNLPLLNKPPCEERSVLSEPPMVSSLAAENKNSIPPPSAKEEESLVSVDDASQSVAAIEISVEKVMLDSNSLDGLKLAQEKVLGLLQAERVDKKESPQKKLSNMFINLHPDKEVKPRLRSEALSDRNSSLSRDEGGQHVPVQKVKNITKENDQKSGELVAIPFRGAVVPVAVSRDSSFKKVIEYLHAPTNNGTTKSYLFCVTEEEESKGLCSQATLAAAATSANQESTRKSLDALSIREHSPNRVVLRFLHEGFQKTDIVKSFSEFGAVLDVQEVPSFEGCIYKDALLTFETKSAVKKALKKGVVMLKHCSAIVEAVSQEDMVEMIRIPDLIGDPDVPVSLVKEPTRTVKIHPLDQRIGSNQIREALRFCKRDISKIIFGSSTTAAFVEFETEEGKERAVAAHSVDVLNKKLFISRIDIPRTTVARISNLSGLMTGDLRKLCVPYGQIKQMFHRGKGVADVHFDISEWPNMLTILNSMNGKERNGKKWVVRPATTVIPNEILKVLWEDPQGMRYVKGLIKDMVREIEQPLDSAALSSLCSALED